MPGIDYFAAASTATVIKAPAAVAADANGAGVDISNYSGNIMLVTGIYNTAGTSPTMATKFQTSVDEELVSNVAYSGTGNGKLTEVSGGPDTVAETVTVHLDSASAFTVTGSVSSTIGTGTVGTKFTSNLVNLMVTAGDTAFVHTDEFTFDLAAQTYVDITGATIANPGAVKTVARTVINSNTCGKYIRPVFDIGGTNAPSYLIGITAFGMVNS